MWKELGLDNVKRGFDTFVKKAAAVATAGESNDSSCALPSASANNRDYQIVVYSLIEAPVVIGDVADFSGDQTDNLSIYTVPISGRPLTVGDVKAHFPIIPQNCLFRFKLEDDMFDFVFMDGLRNEDIAPTFRGSVVLQVLRVPVIVDVHTTITHIPQTSSSPPPSREELIRQREEAKAAQIKAARDFAATNALEEANRRQEKLSAQNQLGAAMDRWALTEQGKFKDVRSLLSSMSSVLWEGSGWIDVPIGDLMISEAAVKKAYRKAIVLCHPDRHQRESADQQYRADRIFNAINESYKVFTNPST
jgi:hypothetical protein